MRLFGNDKEIIEAINKNTKNTETLKKEVGTVINEQNSILLKGYENQKKITYIYIIIIIYGLYKVFKTARKFTIKKK